MVGEDDVPRLLAADVAAALSHALQHIAVANLRTQKLEAGGAQLPLQAKVGHDGGDDAVALELAATLKSKGNQRHQLVTIHNPAFLVDDDQAVGISVERKADIGAACNDRFLKQLRMRRPAILVDIETVRE